MQTLKAARLAALVAACLASPTALDAQEASAEPAPDVPYGDSLLLTTGARMDCEIMTVGEDARMLLRAPFLDGEARVLLSHVQRIRLRSRSQEGGRDYVLMTNDDRLVGRATAITAQTVTVETEAMGTVEIPRNVVRSISSSRASESLVENDFRIDTLDPWRKLRGDWWVEDGVLGCNDSSGPPYAITAQIAQDGPITLEVLVDASEQRRFYVELILFSSDTGSNFLGRNCLHIGFTSTGYWINVRENNRQTRIGGGGNHEVANARRGLLRAAYDPGNGKVYVWGNAALLGEHMAKNAPQAGKFVIIRCNLPHKIEYIRLSSGISPPAGVTDDAAEDTAAIVLANGDRFSAKTLTMTDGVVTAGIALAELPFQMETVRRIVFCKAGSELPRRNRGDVRVHTHRSVITVKLQRLTADELIGTADYLGPVRVRRDAIRSIDFNIYGEQPAAQVLPDSAAGVEHPE
jgi:hypothetical protein